MNNHESDSSEPSTLQIDMGDDLLAEKTVVFENLDLLRTSSNVVVESDPKALLQNAKILMGEGLVEDAKKALRQALLRDPQSEIARRTLEEIQGEELKQIIAGEEGRRVREATQAAKDLESSQWVDSDVLIRKLDEDLNLKIFQMPAVEDGFYERLEGSLSGGTAQDWIDVGIAFLEMDHFSIAARLFVGANRRFRSELADPSLPQAQAQAVLATTGLLVRALMLDGKPFEALSEIQSALQDGEIEHARKIELFYLLGRIHDSLGKATLAQFYYQQVMDIDSHYRDVDQRRLKEN